ncbi:HNH endonuclease signature motif containing protein [Promicromonospora panici]|uniref:HNH endonuclease signature motif containing protein n=1 Tax=Promicromonospora panici TaxID=2219658 RepID=UPI0013EC18C9|nr:HNH endonuclease signature motif containing protein [Promicromonospora panici]
MESTNDTPGGLPPARSVEEALARIEAAIGDLAGLTGAEVLDGWGAPSIGRLVEAHTRIRRLTGRLDGVRYTLLPRIEDEGSWRSGGMARTFKTWLRQREGVSASTADKDLRMAHRLDTALPVTRERLVSGVLGADHARVMAEVAPTSETRTDALGWLIDTRTGETTTPERFVQTVPVDFPDPADDPDGTRTRELITGVLEGAVADGTLATGEGVVLREARLLDADRFRRVAKAFASVTDPDTDDREDDKAAQGEFLDLAKTFGGYHVAGFLTDEHGLLVQTAITAVMGAPAADDTRATSQRRAQGLADVARVVLDTNQASPGAAVAPHLNVTVSWNELVTQVTRTRDGLCLTCGQATPARGTRGGTAGLAGATGATGTASVTGTAAGTTGIADGGSAGAPGWDAAGWGAVGTTTLSGLLSTPDPVFTETGGRVPRALLRRLACDSRITRVVFGPDGAVLDVGRAQRTVTGQMRRAVIARDQHCVYPGCDQPPSRCEVHHAVRHWADGGNTSVTNSALLCWHHHALVDAREISMHWTGKPTDAGAPGALVETGWEFTDARGHRIRLPDAIDTSPADRPRSHRPPRPPDQEAA